MAQESGRQIIKLLNMGITARQILNKKGIENAVRVNAAIAGSTNAILHLPAIAYEADLDLPVDVFDELSEGLPTLRG